MDEDENPSRNDVQLAGEAARLLREAAELIERGHVEEGLAVQQRASQLISNEVRLHRGHAGRSDAGRTVSSHPIRQVVIDSLNDLSVPSSPRAIADYALARFEVRIDTRLLASARRDDRRAWESPRSHRPTYLVPGLSPAAPGTLLALRGKLALSNWPLATRLIGPWSDRVDHLRATVKLAEQALWLRGMKPEESRRIEVLIIRYAMTVPNALTHQGDVDLERVITAARAELDHLEPFDTKWREEAAAVATTQVSGEEQLWGTTLPHVVGAAE